MKATLSEDRTMFTLRRGAWSNTYPVETAAAWLAFYRRLPMDFPKAGGTYEATIKALESLCRELNLPD